MPYTDGDGIRFGHFLSLFRSHSVRSVGRCVSFAIWLKPTSKSYFRLCIINAVHKDCKYENGFCWNHFPWNSAKEKSLQRLAERIFFPFSLETLKIIIDSGVFLLYPFLLLHAIVSFAFATLSSLLLRIMFMLSDIFDIKLKNNGLSAMFCFHFDEMRLGKKKFFCVLKLFSLPNSIVTVSCELLIRSKKKLYADGLQFKWFVLFYRQRILIHINSNR